MSGLPPVNRAPGSVHLVQYTECGIYKTVTARYKTVKARYKTVKARYKTVKVRYKTLNCRERCPAAPRQKGWSYRGTSLIRNRRPPRTAIRP